VGTGAGVTLRRLLTTRTPPRRTQGKKWVGTLFGERDALATACGQVDAWHDSGKLHAAGSQLEACPDTGREHLQFWLSFNQNMRFSTLCKALPGVHLARQGAKNDWDAFKYTQKEESRVESEFSRTWGNTPQVRATGSHGVRCVFRATGGGLKLVVAVGTTLPRDISANHNIDPTIGPNCRTSDKPNPNPGFQGNMTPDYRSQKKRPRSELTPFSHPTGG